MSNAKHIIYSGHLKSKLSLRSIPEELPRTIYEKTNERYYDKVTKHNIALKEVRYKHKLREMAISYDETENEIIIITIHPIKSYQKINRIRIGRWHRI